MYQICIFLPAFISLLIYINICEKKRDIIQVICHYFIYTLLINTICISICHLIFKYDDLTFNLRFTIKYILLASSISLIAPFIIHYIIELIKYIINIIKSGIDKNNMPTNEQINGVLVAFINHVGMSQCIDYALSYKDFDKKK